MNTADNKNFYKEKLTTLLQDSILNNMDKILSDSEKCNFVSFLDYLDGEEKLELAASYMLSMKTNDQFEFLSEAKNSNLFPFFIGTAMLNLSSQSKKKTSDATITAINYIGHEILDYCSESLEEMLDMVYQDYAYEHREMRISENRMAL